MMYLDKSINKGYPGIYKKWWRRATFTNGFQLPIIQVISF